MKKIASLALSILLIPTSLFGNEMFGYRLFEDVRDTHRADMINAETHNETSGGFNVVWINPIKPNGSFQYYNLAYDINDYSIQEVVASANMSSMEFCEIEMETWKGRLERRFKTRLDFDNFSSGGMSTKTYYKNFDEYGLDVRCNEYFDDGAVAMFIIWRSNDLWDAIQEYYDGF